MMVQNLFSIPGEGTPWSAVYRCVIKKTMRKGTFFQEGQCAALTSFRVGKMSFLWKKGMFFTILLKRCEKGTCMLPICNFSYFMC